MVNRAIPMTFLLWVLNGLISLISGQDQVARGEGFYPFISCSQKLDLSPHTLAGTVNMKFLRQAELAMLAHVSWRVYTSKSSEGGMIEPSCTYGHLRTAVGGQAGNLLSPPPLSILSKVPFSPGTYLCRFPSRICPSRSKGCGD